MFNYSGTSELAHLGKLSKQVSFITMHERECGRGITVMGHVRLFADLFIYLSVSMEHIEAKAHTWSRRCVSCDK